MICRPIDHDLARARPPLTQDWLQLHIKCSVEHITYIAIQATLSVVTNDMAMCLNIGRDKVYPQRSHNSVLDSPFKKGIKIAIFQEGGAKTFFYYQNTKVTFQDKTRYNPKN